MNASHVKAMLRQTFQNKAVIIVPECSWTGYECDMLVVHESLRVIDIEIKVSRADFKRDAAKDKWWHQHRWFIEGPQAPRQWPPKVWKHYFAMPASIWKPDLEEFLPSPACGVIVLHDKRQQIVAEVVRRATPNAAAEKIDGRACVDLARLAGIRMWEALAQRQAANDAAVRSQEEAA
ncbi:hypothetical protein OU995_11870 [Roseateles sp. SL47]|uniref:hypothetical protein n=1 Tax=Roseateles sp. SL47 TaxID=2995138 RepID=UPI00226F10BD|nr:hypothetical protein [Roseateles sp. SL47]WAC75346.1 hypothetical protein OU995_11870 [Roseateles sp. SL47]